MERTVSIKARVGYKFISINKLPTSYEELWDIFFLDGNAIDFSILWNNHPITNKRELALAYLNNKDEVIIFEAKFNNYPIKSMDDPLQALFNNMITDISQLSTSGEAPAEPFTIRNGILSKEDLITVIRAQSSRCKEMVSQNETKFIEKRQEFLGIDNEKYRNLLGEQYQCQDILIKNCLAEILKKHGVSPLEFGNSLNAYQNDPDVKEANYCIETLLQSPECAPGNLTEEKLKEIFTFMVDFYNQRSETNLSVRSPEAMTIQFMATDEIYKRFGFDQLQVSAAVAKYDIDSNPDFEEIKGKMIEATIRLFGE